ncbi:11599_t:CDS:2, partial [Rhizophagus irregularis]
TMNTSEPEPQQSSELKISDIFKNHEEFVARAQNCASYCNFQIRLSVSESKEDKVNSRDRKSQRCNCPFFIRALLDNNSGLWHILAMNLEHNHEMVAPEHKMFLSSERIIPQEIKDRIIVYHQAGCNVPTIRSILKQEYKDLETWIYNDIYNFIYQLNGKQEQRFFEAEEFINILKQLKREIDGFEYEVRVDVDTNELLQVIWMYPDQKQYYSRFLDVIVFDNTYKVNRFNMPFGIFTGINNFGQSLCFAGTLMCRETIDSFVWVFNTFLKFVNNYSPKVMLTDEDKAISQAIEITFGQNTKHVLCIWHLWKNVIKNIANVLGTKWREFTKSFYDCIREYEVDNFIIKWQQLKENFPDSKSHLERMDKIKEKWAPCFIRDTFLADMTSTQRGESMNNLMKGYMDASHSLLDFLKAFESALEQ